MPLFQLEVGLSVALWDLFAGDGPDAAIEVLVDMLTEQRADDPAVLLFAERVRRGGSRAWLPRRNPGADLAIIGPDDESEIAPLWAVIEVKAGAHVNMPLVSTANKLTDISGTAPVPLREDTTAGSPLGRDRLSQVDLYRSKRWWIPAVDKVDLHDPDDALWLFFDLQGRTTGSALKGSNSADSWISVDLHEFARRLADRREQQPMRTRHQDMIAVVVWHIDQGSNRIGLTRTTVVTTLDGVVEASGETESDEVVVELSGSK